MPTNYIIDASNSISASNTHGLYDASNCFVWVKQGGSIYSENFNLAGVGLAITNSGSRVVIDGSVSFMAGTSPTGWANYSASGVFLGAGVALTVGATGHINASGYWGGIPALVLNGNDVTNSGSISGQIGIQANGLNTVINTGTITGNSTTAAPSGTGYSVYGIYALGQYHTTLGLHLTNSGSVSGDFAIWGNSLDIENSGTIRGNTTGINALASYYDSYGNSSQITNHGTISANGVAINDMQVVSTIQGAALTIYNDGVIRSGSGVAIGHSYNTTVTEDNAAVLNLTNAGQIFGSVTGGAGADTLNNEVGGRIYGAISLGNGADIYSNDGLVSGFVTLGAGNDTATGSGGRDSIMGGTGDDLIDLGGGADMYGAGTGTTTSDGDDVVEGGTGVDYFSAALVKAGVIVNLSTETASGARMGIDDITGFENVQGSNYGDVITGNALGNVLVGLGGGDRILGGDGRDRIMGNAGADSLTGGAGADVFAFLSASDSGTAAALRDLITDFVVGVDRIDLRQIDANTVLADDQVFQWLGTAAFSGLAGQLHFGLSGATRIVSGDVDGDKVADFAVAVTGTTALTAADFLL